MSSRTDEVGRFYELRAEQIRSAVRAQVATPDHTVIEDACHLAWVTLLRRPDVSLDDRGSAWLKTVAIREGWRLARAPRAIPMGAFRGTDVGPHEMREPESGQYDPQSVAVAREVHARRLKTLSRLNPGERRAVALLALGFSYAEIMGLTGLTYRRLSGQLAGAQHKLRRFDTARDS